MLIIVVFDLSYVAYYIDLIPLNNGSTQAKSPKISNDILTMNRIPLGAARLRSLDFIPETPVPMSDGFAHVL